MKKRFAITAFLTATLAAAPALAKDPITPAEIENELTGYKAAMKTCSKIGDATAVISDVALSFRRQSDQPNASIDSEYIKRIMDQTLHAAAQRDGEFDAETHTKMIAIYYATFDSGILLPLILKGIEDNKDSDNISGAVGMNIATECSMSKGITGVDGQHTAIDEVRAEMIESTEAWNNEFWMAASPE